METERLTRAEVLPVTVEQLKEHLRLTTDDFDGALERHLRGAIAAAESFTGLTLVAGTFRTTGVPEDTVETGVMPIREVTKAEVDGADCLASAEVEGSRVRLPGAAGKRAVVEFTGGYEELPGDVVSAILLIAGRFFTNPADSVEQLPKASTNLLRPYKRWGR